VETKVSETGEVLVRSPMNMTGYYKDPEGTRAAFTDEGFFRTGDLGEMDEDGWLKITGRLKEQFKTSKGKYVSPSRIEKLLSVHPAIENCCVVGAGMTSAFAVILLAKDFAASHTNIEEVLRQLLDDINAQVDLHERVAFLVVTDEPWSVANGILTPTLKLKRSVLEEHYARYFDQWANQKKAIIWHKRNTSAGG